MSKPGKQKSRGRKRPSARSAASLPRELEIDGYAWGGKAVGRLEGKVVFVPGAVPGDRILVRLRRSRARYAEGSVHAVLSPSPDRIPPKCKFSSHCGGCQWIAARYERQLSEKDDLLRRQLGPLLGDARVEPPVPAAPHRRCRSRAVFHIRQGGSGLVIGFHQEGAKRVINLDRCPLLTEELEHAYAAQRTMLRRTADPGLLLKATLSASTGRAAGLYLFRDGAGRAVLEATAEAALRAGLDGVCCESRDPGHAMVSAGSPFTAYRLPSGDTGLPADLTLRAHPASFRQAHEGGNGRLVGRALRWLDPSPSDRVLDLYSGIGNFSLPLSLRSGEVSAVESSPFAHADAEKNMRLAGAGNLRLYRTDCGEWLERERPPAGSYPLILLDPPRAGAREILPRITALEPERILYVSCWLPSLRRDLEALAESGYRVARIGLIDLFPQTYSMETTCLLVKGRARTVIA